MPPQQVIYFVQYQQNATILIAWWVAFFVYIERHFGINKYIVYAYMFGHWRDTPSDIVGRLFNLQH